MNTRQSLYSEHSRGQKFFSSPTLRSPAFLVLSSLVLLTVAADLFILAKYGKRMEFWLAVLFLVFGVGGVLVPWVMTIRCHKRVHRLLTEGRQQGSQEDARQILDVTATMTLDALYFTFASISILVVTVGYLIAGGPMLTH